MTRRVAILLWAIGALGCGQEKSQPLAAAKPASADNGNVSTEAAPNQGGAGAGPGVKGKGGAGAKGKGGADRPTKAPTTPNRARAVELLNARGGKYWDAAGKQDGPIVGATVTGFGDADLAELVAAAPTLQVVELPNTINNRGVGVLADLPDLRHIKGCASLATRGFAALKSARKLSFVEVIDGRADDFIVPAIVELPALTKLTLRGCTKLTDAGVKTLATNPRITELVLRGCPITDESVPALGSMKALKVLDVSETKITAGGVAKLKAALPGARVEGAK